MEFLKRILKDIRRGENIDLVGTIVLAFVIVIISFFSVAASALVTPLTLAVLCFLPISNIVNRYKLEDFSKSLSNTNTPFLQNRKNLSKFTDSAKDARDILIVAASASGLLLETQFFVNKINQGTKVRLAVIDPNEKDVVEILGRGDVVPAEVQRADMKTATGLVERIKSKVQNPYLFEVRYFNYVPTHSFVIVDGHLPTGYMTVEMYLFQVDPGLRPHLLVKAKDHPDWFSYFRDIGEAIWQDANVAGE